MEFKLIDKDFIELNKLIKFLGWCESGGEANQIINEGLVSLNGENETRKRCKLRPNDVVSFNGKEVIVIS
tara:strand:- start:212 stop:421 length:210 start_codon:yes stop_codon:yes gene_type:complete